MNDDEQSDDTQPSEHFPTDVSSKNSGQDDLPYEIAPVHSLAEKKFFGVLKRYTVVRRCELNFKMRLADVCKCKETHWPTHGKRIALMHVDCAVG